jgi:hypothetical protein
VPKTSVRASIPPKRFANHVALTSSIGEPSSFVEQVWSDAMMEESDVWETVLEPLVGSVIDSKIALDLDL